jgi:hypothetical protein
MELLVLKKIDEQANENGTGVNRPKNEYFVQKMITLLRYRESSGETDFFIVIQSTITIDL